jgi:hypothetical protein
LLYKHTVFSCLSNKQHLRLHALHTQPPPPFSVSLSLSETCFYCDKQCCKCLFSCYVDTRGAKAMKNNCVQRTCVQGLCFSCYLVFCSIRHLQQCFHAVSPDRLSCHMFIIQKGKGKGVLLHAMEAHGGRGGIAPANT